MQEAKKAVDLYDFLHNPAYAEGCIVLFDYDDEEAWFDRLERGIFCKKYTAMEIVAAKWIRSAAVGGFDLCPRSPQILEC